MSKKFVLFIVSLIILVSYLFSFEKVLANKIYAFNSSISSTYIKLFVFSADTINKYFNQLNYIDQLKKSNESNLKYKSMYERKVQEIADLNKSVRLNLNKELKYDRVKVLSYVSFDDYSKVLIDKDITNKDKIYSLITLDGYSAGIVLTQNKKSVAYLNENIKCNYTVFIGDDDTPGITSGSNNDGNIVIKYVPIWKEIHIGDEVITSSMDSIFPFGVKVGKVIQIKEYENTKEVLVKPYGKTLGERNFFIIDDLNTTI